MGLLADLKKWATERRQAQIEEIEGKIRKDLQQIAKKEEESIFSHFQADPLALARELKMEKRYVDLVFSRYRRPLLRVCGPTEIAQMRETALQELQAAKKEILEQREGTPLGEIEQILGNRKKSTGEGSRGKGGLRLERETR